MTKLDERATVPAVDEAACRRLAAALDQDGVVSALLFGSHATGKAGPLSDIDVAVWVDPELEDRERGERGMALLEAASQALSTDEVQLVVLNDASPLLRHRALRDGVRLVDRDPADPDPPRGQGSSRVPRHGAPARNPRRGVAAPDRGGTLWSTLRASQSGTSAASWPLASPRRLDSATCSYAPTCRSTTVSCSRASISSTTCAPSPPPCSACARVTNPTRGYV